MKCAGTFFSVSSLRKWKTPASRTGASVQAIHDAVHLRKFCGVSVGDEAELPNNSADATERKSVQRFRMSLAVSDYSPKLSRNSRSMRRGDIEEQELERARRGRRFSC